MKLYQRIAASVEAYHRCVKHNNAEWRDKHAAAVAEYAKRLPSGAGVDNGSKIDLERSHGNRLVCTTAYHHMNDVGIYDGWTEHTVIITPSLVSGIEVSVKGRNRNDIVPYLAELFSDALNNDVP